jgi:5-methylcytosine-specific restriction enzyme subunit McrC
MNNKTFTISEYGLISTEPCSHTSKKFTSVCVPLEAYEEFEAFAKTENGGKVLGFSGRGDQLKAKNYVGTIQTQRGYTLEILPKIYKQHEETASKSIFIELLRILYKLPSFKQVDTAHFHSENMPVLEIFIEMFLDEVGTIIKQGIKHDYVEKIENEYYLKGKLLVSGQIKHNHMHRERFYIRYDEYSPNRVENRLLKSTLKYLVGISNFHNNIRRARQYMEHLQMVDFSRNIDADFKKCHTGQRGMKHYENALIWAKIFLKKESFSRFSGESIAFAILYPMNQLFESYVEQWLWENESDIADIIITTVKDTFVKDTDDKVVTGVKPDYLIKIKNHIKIVADAKWKIINKNGDFKNKDFYQLFVYKHIYETMHSVENIELRLYYPKSDFLNEKKSYRYFCNSDITICPLDMNDLIKSQTQNKAKETT